MLSTKMFLAHLDRNKPVDENAQPKSVSKSENKINKRVLQPKSSNIKTKQSKLSSKTSIKDFISDVPNIKCERKRKLEIFDETVQTAKKSKTIATQTSPDAVDLMCSETPSDKYWELLAEERRKALHEALDENKQLADEVEKKDELIKDLQSEVKSLEETASQAEYLASVIEQLGEDCLNKTDDQTDSCSSSDDNLSDGKTKQPETCEKQCTEDATDEEVNVDENCEKLCSENTENESRDCVKSSEETNKNREDNETSSV